MEFSDPRMAAAATEYEQRHRDELARMTTMPGAEILARRDEFPLPVGTEVAGLLHALVRARKPRTNQLWLFDAVPRPCRADLPGAGDQHRSGRRQAGACRDDARACLPCRAGRAALR
ncbi:MAG: hypothetical protein P0Y56_13515 [Candidatus Andeanibacterium colombiense]|uniref:Uncharacterized protein n=1 Tax=Candidatus Andeanibacterium colombiense TaxID=3121345 RepID=A0AAJ5X569_9SPHN|nr:MAG: hypothetical protein P0Y56_13515 [Sphingomonadaceae bacterium]